VAEVESASLSAGYSLRDGPPSTSDYLHLRAQAGLSPKTEEQAEAAISGSWAGCHVVYEADSCSVAMGRVIGDGGWWIGA
jgi:hypothetical protein